ncbi:MAG: hypothetical protein ACRDD1_21125 [Planctomycetia bacterium]
MPIDLLGGASSSVVPADLSHVVAVWPSLPPSIRAAIHAMVDAFDKVEKR